MRKDKLQKSVIVACILSAIALSIAVFSQPIDMFFKDINYLLSALLVLIFFIVFIVCFIRNIVFIIKNRKNLSPRIYLPSVIYSAAILLCFFLPSSESFESAPVIFGYFKGTQNQAFVKFRSNKTFELNWSGVFGYNEWFTGNYNKNGDTLFLTYDGAKPIRFGQKILYKDSMLSTLDVPRDSNQYFVPFKVLKRPKNK